MTEAADVDMRAEEAVDLLAGIEGYEESLTAKTAGLTALVWGTAIPALFVTYNAGGHWIVDHGAPGWIYGLLWIPWIAGASLITNWLWELTSVTLDRSRESGWPTSVAFTLLFFLVAGLVWGALILAGADFGVNGWMVLSTGVFTILQGGIHRIRGWVGSGETIVAGMVITLGGLPIALAPGELAADVAFGFASAALIAIAYYAAGMALYLRG